MASEQELDDAITETCEAVHEVGDDTARFTQQESIEFYQAVADDCLNMVRSIQHDIDEEAARGDDTDES